MFHKELVSSDKFIDMPMSSQALFFHLGINADDDGFVSSPKRIQRSIGSSADDMKILITKNFVVGFESGVIVISDWSKHNQIRKDRYTETLHIAEKQLLQAIDFEQVQPVVTDLATNGKPSVVKVSSVEVSLEEVNKHTERDSQFSLFWEAYGKKGNRKTAMLRFRKLTNKQVEEVQTNLPAYLYKTNENLQYRKNAEVYLNPEKEHWNDYVFIEQPTDELTF